MVRHLDSSRSRHCRNSSFDYVFYYCNFFLSVLEWLKIFNYTCFKICSFLFVSYTKTISLLLHVSQPFLFLYLKCSPNCNKYSSQPTFQRRINVVSTLWINVEITLIRRWKWNKIRRRIFNVAQRWYNIAVWRWSNVEKTLIQLYLDVVSTWSQH